MKKALTITLAVMTAGFWTAHAHGAERYVETAPAEEFVHQKRSPGHIAGVLQQSDEQEQDENLRQEDHHAAHTADDPVRYQALHDRHGGKPRSRDGLRPGGPCVNQIHHWTCPGIDRLKHQPHDPEENEAEIDEELVLYAKNLDSKPEHEDLLSELEKAYIHKRGKTTPIIRDKLREKLVDLIDTYNET